MTHVAALLFRLGRIGRCPCCGAWTRFSEPLPALSGPIPPELEGLVPHIAQCQRRGCTSSLQAITGLELRTATPEA